MDYWKIRAKKYNELNWVTNKKLLQELINFAKLKKQDKVIDVGCGTGVLSNAIVDKVEQVYAIDKSEEMLDKGKFNSEITHQQWDLEDYFYINGYFDKVIARMVFHHIFKIERAFQVCYSMLKKGGWLIIEEGIPPTDKASDWYIKMMDAKEKRTTFSKSILKTIYQMVRFKNIKSKIIINKNFSVNNWLNSSGQNKEMLKCIYDFHLNAPKDIKDAYKMKIKKDGEIIIQTKILLIKGQK